MHMRETAFENLDEQVDEYLPVCLRFKDADKLQVFAAGWIAGRCLRSCCEFKYAPVPSIGLTVIVCEMSNRQDSAKFKIIRHFFLKFICRCVSLADASWLLPPQGENNKAS